MTIDGVIVIIIIVDTSESGCNEVLVADFSKIGKAVRQLDGAFYK